MKNVFGNGCTFTQNAHGQKIDEEGFATSSVTYITNRRTCVSVKVGDDRVQLRNTEDVSKNTLAFNRDEWKAFLEGVKNGEFDLLCSTPQIVNNLAVINYGEVIYKIMKFKIPSKKIKGKFIYGDFVENKKATTLVVFLSGLSGGCKFPLFETASSEFLKHGFSTIRFNFCNDGDDEYKKVDAINLEELSFSVYVTELKNILDLFSKKYSRIVLVGHSFGAPIAVSFLSKYKKYSYSTELVLWDPTILPWKKQWMEEDFVFDKDKGLYFGKHAKEVINKVFYGECVRVDTVNILQMLKRNACILAARNSADKDASKYFSKVHKKKTSVLHIIEKTDHYFKGSRAQKELFKTTLNFLDLNKKEGKI